MPMTSPFSLTSGPPLLPCETTAECTMLRGVVWEDGVDHAVGEHDLGDGVEVAPEEPQVGGILLGNEGGEAPCAYLVGPVDGRG